MKYILKIDFRGLAVQNSQPILACLIKRKFGRQLLQALRQVTKGIETARAECKDAERQATAGKGAFLP